MAVMDEFKEEREALKHAGFKQRLSYYAYYYKWHVIVSIIAVVCLGSMIYEMVTAKDTAFYAVMLNTLENEETSKSFKQAFMEYAGINPDKYELLFDTSLHISPDKNSMDEATVSSTQKLMVYMAAAELDAILTDSTSIRQYANSEYFFDLREILSEEQLAKYESYFYYVDMAEVRALQKAQENLDDTYVAEFPDPKKPEEMKEPVPVGLYIDREKLNGAYYFPDGDLVLGIFSNTQHLDNALKYIDFLFEA